jgi:predicted Zn-dependent protease
MNQRVLHHSLGIRASLAAFIVALATAGAAQTTITAPKNKYSPKEDVELGRKAAAEVEKQFPLLRNSQVANHVDEVGDRLATVIPRQFQHPEFEYSFKVVNARDINAFSPCLAGRCT